MSECNCEVTRNIKQLEAEGGGHVSQCPMPMVSVFLLMCVKRLEKRETGQKMLTMTRSYQVLCCVLLAAGSITNVASQDCAFIPGPIAASSDTAVITMDCNRQQRDDDDDGIGDITGNRTGLVVYLYNCVTVPIDLFVNVSTSLSAVTVVSEDSEVLRKGTFEGLGNIAELRLEGFRTLRSLGNHAFRPLRNLERLVLVGFDAHRLSYAELGAALHELSGTPLRRIVMHEIHSVRNEKALDVTSLFQMRNVSVRELTFSNNVVTRITGRISRIFPELNYICVGANARYYAAVSALIDMWLFLPSINEISIYAYPVPDSPNPSSSGVIINISDLDPAILWAMLPYLGHGSCYSGLKLPLNPSLRRLTVRNLQMLDDVVDKPICFDESNRLEYLDFGGSPLPPTTTRIRGLNQLKYFDIQNTGITELSDDFLRYFPKLERIKLVRLPIGESLTQVNSSFFGDSPTLKEIDLGECQLTTIPPNAFVLLPALETLNLSSNLLQTLDVNFSNKSHLSHLNLSGNVISSLSEDVLVQLNEIAQLRLQDGEMLTVDLRRNALSCLCNSTHFVRQLQDWVMKHEVNVPGFELYTCLYPNNSLLAMSHVDVDRLKTQCSVLSEVKNGSDCPCDDDLRQRLELIRLSLHGYVCRNPDGELTSMSARPLPSCPEFFRNATFIAPVVVVGVLALSLVVTLIVLYRYRRNKRINQIIQRLSMSRIVRLGIQHVLARNREDPSSFSHEVFLYIHDDDQEAARCWFDTELFPYRHVVSHDDFSVGLKLECLLENIGTCRWLVPVLSANFVDDGECCDFIARAQYTRPHAIVPVVWTPFYTDDLTINNLLDSAEPITWPGERAPDVDKAAFWKTLRERTGSLASAE